ncbi:prepilin peptidase [Lonsdalea quercina]|uniref:prepilin peptidase n=1 Tax=Lonsdalea quercina TaxID=71657 RepID=UPI003975BF37
MELAAFAGSFPLVWLAALVLLGLIVGSFLNVVIHRLPEMLARRWRQEACRTLEMDEPEPGKRYDLCWPPSSCPRCRQPLRLRDNVPLLSWLWLRGRSHCCRQPISGRYPLTELMGGLLFLMAGLLWPPGEALLGALVLFSVLLTLAMVDIHTRLLPDVLTLPLLWAGLLFNVDGAFVPLTQAVVGAIAGYLSLWLVYWAFRWFSGKEALGYGDFKLLAALGAWLGWASLPNVVLIASLAGLALTLLWRLIRGGSLQASLAFGPWLALAGAIGLVLNAVG